MAKKPIPEGKIVEVIEFEGGGIVKVNDAYFRGTTHEDGEKIMGELVDFVRRDIYRRIANGEVEKLLAQGVVRRRTPEEMAQLRQG